MTWVIWLAALIAFPARWAEYLLLARGDILATVIIDRTWRVAAYLVFLGPLIEELIRYGVLRFSAHWKESTARATLFGFGIGMYEFWNKTHMSGLGPNLLSLLAVLQNLSSLPIHMALSVIFYATASRWRLPVTLAAHILINGTLYAVYYLLLNLQVPLIPLTALKLCAVFATSGVLAIVAARHVGRSGILIRRP